MPLYVNFDYDIGDLAIWNRVLVCYITDGYLTPSIFPRLAAQDATPFAQPHQSTNNNLMRLRGCV